MTAHPGPLPVPARITLALDAAGLFGPQVDIDLGGVEPMVDEWEAGVRLPTPEQLERLAVLTGHPVAWFTAPIEERSTTVFICDRRRRTRNALTVARSTVGWDGVLTVEELTPPKPPYRPRPDRKPGKAQQPIGASGGRRATVRGAHQPVAAEGTPDVCTCGLRISVGSRYHLT